MNKTVVVGAVLALGLGASSNASSRLRPAELDAAEIAIHYTTTTGEARIVVSADAEIRLQRVQVRAPAGAGRIDLQTQRNSDVGFMGFVVESGEGTLAELQAAFPEGDYSIRARTMDGRPAIGWARLSHALPRAPIVAYPTDGMVDVPTTGLVLQWDLDPEAVSYRVNLEQNETDVMTVVLRPGTSSFRVPDGVLEAGMRSQLEIGSVGPNGNSTVVEILFGTL
jgi:hypothetical protein